MALALPPVAATAYPLPAPTINLFCRFGVPLAPLHNWYPVGIDTVLPDHIIIPPIGTNAVVKSIFAVVTALGAIFAFVIELSSKVVTNSTLPVPSKETAGASTTPVIVKVLEVCN